MRPSGPVLFGHRGAKGEAPENTLTGFAYARSIGLRAVEFDVRMTRDGELVVIHDARVDRTTDGTGLVAELSGAEIRTLDARAGFVAAPSGVPTLTEVLDAVSDLDVVEIEIKRDSAGRTEAVVERLLETLRDHQLGADVILASFHLDVLRQLQRAGGGWPTALIGRWESAATVMDAMAVGATRANVQHTTSSATVATAARSAGLSVVGWPCNSLADAELLRRWQVDAMTTDLPRLLLGD